jgi:hypothetical protein
MSCKMSLEGPGHQIVYNLSPVRLLNLLIHRFCEILITSAIHFLSFLFLYMEKMEKNLLYPQKKSEYLLTLCKRAFTSVTMSCGCQVLSFACVMSVHLTMTWSGRDDHFASFLDRETDTQKGESYLIQEHRAQHNLELGFELNS